MQLAVDSTTLGRAHTGGWAPWGTVLGGTVYTMPTRDLGPRTHSKRSCISGQQETPGQDGVRPDAQREGTGDDESREPQRGCPEHHAGYEAGHGDSAAPTTKGSIRAQGAQPC